MKAAPPEVKAAPPVVKVWETGAEVRVEIPADPRAKDWDPPSWVEQVVVSGWVKQVVEDGATYDWDEAKRVPHGSWAACPKLYPRTARAMKVL